MSGRIVIAPIIPGLLSSLGIQGKIPISLQITRLADWPEIGQVSAWEMHSERFVYEPGLEIILPVPSFYAEGQDGALGTLSISVPALRFTWDGSDAPIGTLNISIPVSIFLATGSIGITGILNALLPIFKFTLRSLPGEAGTLSIPIPISVFSVSGNLSVEATFAIPIPILNTIFRVLTPYDSYLNMVMNIENQALTLYTNYPFNSMCKFNGKHLGAMADKIYDLDSGETDNGDIIEWNFRLGYLNLEEKMKKKIKQAWLSYKSSGDLIATILTPDGQSYEYPVEAVDITEGEIKVVFGKGIRSKYVALDIKNVDGSSVSFDTLRINLDTYKKIR
jgi:hypothetical protein